MSKNARVEFFWSEKGPMSRIIVELPMEPTDPSLSKTEGYRKISDEIVKLLVEYDDEIEKRAKQREDEDDVYQFCNPDPVETKDDE